ncbi:MAG: hypothetical protein CSA72_10475 [Rhodobacterales bacterium]|nr:MAG: hypothetical protein CSA72_10475 [Rhodobacterales bacterium]
MSIYDGVMIDVSSIKGLIGLWPKRAAMAEAVSEAQPLLPVTVHQVNKWAEVGSIPAKYHHGIVRAAQAAGHQVTADLIVRLHAPVPAVHEERAAE